MVLILLSVLVVLSAGITILAQYRESARLEYVFKPLTTVLIIVVALVSGEGFFTSRYQTFILLGLAASLAGDVFLMFPARFTPGLAAFLTAHLFYIAAFTVAGTGRASLWYAIPFVAYGALILWRLWPSLGAMKIPVLAYVGVILIMAWQAANRWLETRDAAGALALFGAYLFVASDSVLAVNRFRGPVKRAPFWVLSTYFAAQLLIALSVSI
ncbi:MAG TPA: lysoplasmalogenase [Aggregatilinea sp.]|uniref:lysoplasmalogenase n=1 Tax=Aggregatilinea sp. TaxID=2806333 RepID=UPI002BEF1DBB|nr:lysoplasmalogenase [Aggregatilinea sp.]HML24649.1 lysoplasmalogenase [Aggregatilinea sp.]